MKHTRIENGSAIIETTELEEQGIRFTPADVLKLAAIIAIAIIYCTMLILGFLSGNMASALLGIMMFSFMLMMGILISWGFKEDTK